MPDLVKTAWNKVNDAETREELNAAEIWVRENVKDNDSFDELMQALAFKSRELYHRDK